MVLVLECTAAFVVAAQLDEPAPPTAPTDAPIAEAALSSTGERVPAG
jgi:hypothetical protein